MNNILDIQRSIIHSLLVANRNDLSTLEIKKYLFPIPLHQNIINCVQWLYTNEKEITEDLIIYYVNKHYPLSLEDKNEHCMVLTQNQMTIPTAKSYLEVLEDNHNSKRSR